MEAFDVKIVFTSRIVNRQHPAANQMTQSVLPGRVTEGAGSLYLTFSDYIEEAGEADYTIKIKEDEAMVRRKGALPMRQRLFIGQPMPGTYEAPYGTIVSEATALKIEAFWDRSRRFGEARLVYEMVLGGQYVGQCRLDFRFTGDTRAVSEEKVSAVN
ncbi:DUF1934 domain-containing protein [Sporolactobacillus sp. THM7-7]|nr:DUF1934 domain-containing protein [Sporolactobacillus sp. THM7-7]